ncbi:MAG: GTPase HflX, partial [Bacteroidia bacterium]|nr:GTPase HflX [Bacteroidia bacterium]
RLPDEMEEGEEDIPYLDRLKNTWMAKENAPAIFISATNKTNVQELKDAVVELVKQHSKVTYFK